MRLKLVLSENSKQKFKNKGENYENISYYLEEDTVNCNARTVRITYQTYCDTRGTTIESDPTRKTYQ
jgi:hypothetical protein